MPSQDGSTLRVLGTALYLACSWTWCIGMFLPLLLVRDFGLAGFWVFAIPNVIGAAAMGFVLTRREQVDRIRSEHGPLLATFGVVTVLFQLYFAGAILPSAVAFMLPVVLCIGVLLATRFWALCGTAAIVWAVSVLLLILGAAEAEGRVLMVERFAAATADGDGLLLLAPAVVVGFLACPYLDLTFLRARSSLPAAGARAAFAVGFGFFFLVMILGTLTYQTAGAVAIVLVFVHVSIQLAFTTLVHAGELHRRWQSIPKMAVLAAVLMLAVLAGIWARSTTLSHAGFELWEIGYRLFMSFYGLVFPAYVWLCMIPAGSAGEQAKQRRWTVWLATIALAAPFYWMGFIERQEVWLLPGVAIVLLARLAIPGGTAFRSPAAA